MPTRVLCTIYTKTEREEGERERESIGRLEGKKVSDIRSGRIADRRTGVFA